MTEPRRRSTGTFEVERTTGSHEVLDRLFVYGTLRLGQTARSLIANNITHSVPASTFGAIYAFPMGYPGFCEVDGKGRVHGEVVWLTDEAHMDAVTAVSGSGPAYVFHLVECMAKAGAEAGLPPELAMRLARATVSGAGAMLVVSPEEAAKLRQNVTSPGGTTEAALKVLMAAEGLQPLMTKAIAAAAKRSHELAQ